MNLTLLTKLLWVDLQRRLIRIPYNLRALRERFFPVLTLASNPALYDADYINERVNYYNKIDASFEVQNPIPFRQQKFNRHEKINRSNYYVKDLYHLLAGMNIGERFDYLFGDVIHIPPRPTIVKSRPIHGDNRNSVMLKICKLRHFRLVRDPVSYELKKDLAVWRGAIRTNPNRRKLLVDSYKNHPLCDVADVPSRKGLKALFAADYKEISAQLQYKFIISVEGVDVASNLKWIMSSNSLCMAQKLVYETWFMEGTLIPNFHYVELADDFSDLGEKIAYYLAHPDKARAIIANANDYVAQFLNENRKDYIGRQMLMKYFTQSGQLN